jgi:hypothetical protein
VERLENSLKIDRELDALNDAITSSNIPSADNLIKHLEDGIAGMDDTRLQRFKGLKKEYVKIVKEQLLVKK